MKKLCDSWNIGLDTITTSPGALTPDTPTPLVHYGNTIAPADHTAIPEADMPPGLPDWMRGAHSWATCTGANAAAKRANLTITAALA
jgi:uracil-DNA glycosylase